MSYSLFSYTSKANPNLLSERLYRQQWRDHVFGKFVAPEFVRLTMGDDVSPSNLPQPGEEKFVGAPIEVFEQFVKYGRTHIDIPVRNRLTGLPVHGDQPLKGTGERINVVYRSVDINYTRKAVKPPTATSLQIVKQYADKIAFDAEAQLKTWLSDYHPGNFILSMCAGASRDLLMPTTMGGRAYGVKSHPNFYVAGSGQVAFANGAYTSTPGTAAYEAAVQAALDNMANTSQFGLTLQMLSNLKLEAIRKRIAPIAIKGGFKFFPVFISDAQWVQVQQDPTWKDVYKRLPINEQMQNHPLFNGAVGYWDGMVLYVDQDMFAAHTNAESGGIVTANKVWYGPVPSSADASNGIYFGNWIPSLDTGNLKVGFLMGKSALAVGVAVPQTKEGRFGGRMVMTDEVDDHGFFQEIGLSFIQSVVRSDVYDQDGQTGLAAGTFYENTSSLAFATYSSHDETW